MTPIATASRMPPPRDGATMGPYGRTPPGYIPPPGSRGVYGAGPPIIDEDDEPPVYAPRPPAPVPGALPRSGYAARPPAAGAMPPDEADGPPPTSEPRVITSTEPDRNRVQGGAAAAAAGAFPAACCGAATGQAQAAGEARRCRASSRRRCRGQSHKPRATRRCRRRPRWRWHRPRRPLRESKPAERSAELTGVRVRKMKAPRGHPGALHSTEKPLEWSDRLARPWSRPPAAWLCH